MMTAAVGLIWWPRRHRTTPFHWSWAIPLISIFLSAADLCYLYAWIASVGPLIGALLAAGVQRLLPA